MSSSLSSRLSLNASSWTTITSTPVWKARAMLNHATQSLAPTTMIGASTLAAMTDVRTSVSE